MRKIGNEKLLELYVNEMIEISNNRAISQSSRFELLKKEILQRMKKHQTAKPILFLPGHGKC
jgi:hypothetical protein